MRSIDKPLDSSKTAAPLPFTTLFPALAAVPITLFLSLYHHTEPTFPLLFTLFLPMSISTISYSEDIELDEVGGAPPTSRSNFRENPFNKKQKRIQKKMRVSALERIC